MKTTLKITCAILISMICIKGVKAQEKTITKNREVGIIYNPQDKLGFQAKWGKKENKYWRFAMYSSAKAESNLLAFPNLKNDYDIKKVGYNVSFGRERRMNLAPGLQFGVGFGVISSVLASRWDPSDYYYGGYYFDFGFDLPLTLNYTYKNVILSAGLVNKLSASAIYEEWPHGANYSYNSEFGAYLTSTRQATLGLAWKFTKVKKK